MVIVAADRARLPLIVDCGGSPILHNADDPVREKIPNGFAITRAKSQMFFVKKRTVFAVYRHLDQ